jgi:hypothetical protein
MTDQKFQRLFNNVANASRCRLVAEVVASKECHSEHGVGRRIVFDTAGNLLTRESPKHVLALLMPNLTVLISAFFEHLIKFFNNLFNGRPPV